MTTQKGPENTRRQWISATEAARRIDVTQRTIYRYINAGDLPAVKVGSLIRIATDDFDRWLEAHRIEI